ncbi:MAG: hypothetical protein JWP88_127 [Flaviaesturariibacter sp.]|nr:hypothetical protein [Flaviaesturariibacter sp.]
MQFDREFGKRHPENNKFTGNADGTNLRLLYNYWGSSSTAGLFSWTNTSNTFEFPTTTKVKATTSGNIKFPNNDTYSYLGTKELSFNNLLFY